MRKQLPAGKNKNGLEVFLVEFLEPACGSGEDILVGDSGRKRCGQMLALLGKADQPQAIKVSIEPRNSKKVISQIIYGL